MHRKNREQKGIEVEVAIIDDELFFFEIFKSTPHKIEYHLFDNAMALFLACEDDESLLKKIRYILVDKVSSRGDNLQNKFAHHFRKAFPQFSGEIILYSSAFGKVTKPGNLNGYDSYMIKKDIWSFIERIEKLA